MVGYRDGLPSEHRSRVRIKHGSGKKAGQALRAQGAQVGSPVTQHFCTNASTGPAGEASVGDVWGLVDAPRWLQASSRAC